MKIKKPVFWNNKNLISISLFPFSIITFLVNLFKNLSLRKKYNIKTICVGNLYIGGTGKTCGRKTGAEPGLSKATCMQLLRMRAFYGYFSCPASPTSNSVHGAPCGYRGGDAPRTYLCPNFANAALSRAASG